jgi:hypothetical protein
MPVGHCRVERRVLQRQLVRQVLSAAQLVLPELPVRLVLPVRHQHLWVVAVVHHFQVPALLLVLCRVPVAFHAPEAFHVQVHLGLLLRL